MAPGSAGSRACTAEVSPVRARTRRELPSEDAGALAHPGEATAGARGDRRPIAVVADLELERVHVGPSTT